jgi:hypothetical protein
MMILCRLTGCVLAVLAGGHQYQIHKPIQTLKEVNNASTFIQPFTTTTTTTTEPYRISDTGDWDWDWLATLVEPPISYWDKVAQCESKSNWKDRGFYAGGLGIALSAWKAFGGLQYSPKQYNATKQQQIEVANNIALHGYQNPNGDDKQPVGFTGWGCIRNNKYLQPPVDNARQAWRKYVKSN